MQTSGTFGARAFLGARMAVGVFAGRRARRSSVLHPLLPELARGDVRPSLLPTVRGPLDCLARLTSYPTPNGKGIIMKRIAVMLACFVCLLAPFAHGAGISWLEVEPTLLSSEQPTTVVATTTGPRFYSTPEPPVLRVVIYQAANVITNLEPRSVSRTQLTFRVPPLPSGFYGFRVRVQDPDTSLWSTVYESSERFLRIAPDTNLRQVFNTLDALMPDYQTPPRQFLTTTQCVVRGVVSGTRSMGHYANDGPGALDYKWLKNFDYDGEGDCGIRFAFDCILDGYSMFKFAIPFEMLIDLPARVYPGQPIQFAPREFRYLGGDGLTNGHSLDFSTVHNLMVNAPYDALPPLDIQLTQLPDKLQVRGSVPVLPWVDFDFETIDVGWPFDQGEATFNGVTVRLGGHADYTTSGQAVLSSQGIRTISTQETELNHLWSVAGDQILFLAEAPIPYVQPAAALLASARVQFLQNFNLIVRSRDLISVDTPTLLEFEAQAPPQTGPWHLQGTLTFPVSATLWSAYTYELGAGFTFDMPIIDPVPIPSGGPVAFAPVYSTALRQAEVFTVSCTLDAYTEVISSNSWRTTFAPPTVTGAVQVVNYSSQQVADEQSRIANLVFPPPALPQPERSVWTNTLVAKPESELALLLNVQPPGSGSVTVSPPPIDGGYANGTLVTIIAQPANGYVFAAWTGDANGTESPKSLVMDSVKWLTANFKPLSAPPQVVAWGNDDDGETRIPPGSSNAVAVAAGNGFSCALRADGTVESWGTSSSQQTNVPAGLFNVVAVSAGWSHTLALKHNGTVVAWGAGSTLGAYPDLGQALVPAGLSDIVAVAGGATHSLALNDQGKVFAWGGRGFGETNVPPEASNVVAIAGGVDYSLALRGDGRVVAWGASAYGAATPPSTISDAVAIAASWYHALAVRRDGTVAAWGAGTLNSGTFPHLGQSMVPTGLRDVIAVAAGTTFSLALKRDGTVQAWGAVFSPAAGGYVPMGSPAGLANVTALAAGAYHCLAVVNGGGPEIRLHQPECSAGVFSVLTPAQRGKAYFLEHTQSLSEPSWLILPPVYGDNTAKRLSDPIGTAAQRLYRVRCY